MRLGLKIWLCIGVNISLMLISYQVKNVSLESLRSAPAPAGRRRYGMMSVPFPFTLVLLRRALAPVCRGVYWILLEISVEILCDVTCVSVNGAFYFLKNEVKNVIIVFCGSYFFSSFCSASLICSLWQFILLGYLNLWKVKCTLI
jgi:hypothetical protein